MRQPISVVVGCPGCVNYCVQRRTCVGLLLTCVFNNDVNKQ